MKIEGDLFDSPRALLVPDDQTRAAPRSPRSPLSRRRVMPPRTLSRKGSRRFHCSDGDLSLRDKDHDVNLSPSNNTYSRGFIPKTLSLQGSSRESHCIDSDSSLDMSSSSLVMLGSTASHDPSTKNSEELTESMNSMRRFLDGLIEEDEDEQKQDEADMDDVLSDSLRGVRSKSRNRRPCTSQAD